MAFLLPSLRQSVSLWGPGVTVTLGEPWVGVGIEPEAAFPDRSFPGGLQGERSALLRKVGTFGRERSQGLEPAA